MRIGSVASRLPSSASCARDRRAARFSTSAVSSAGASCATGDAGVLRNRGVPGLRRHSPVMILTQGRFCPRHWGPRARPWMPRAAPSEALSIRRRPGDARGKVGNSSACPASGRKRAKWQGETRFLFAGHARDKCGVLRPTHQNPFAGAVPMTIILQTSSAPSDRPFSPHCWKTAMALAPQGTALPSAAMSASPRCPRSRGALSKTVPVIG